MEAQCQAVATAFMEEGHFAAHIRRMREMYRNQRDTLVAALRRRLGDHLTVDPPDQGMHLVAYTRRGLSDVAIEWAAREHGVLYGLTTVVMALATGWMASIVFRRD